MFFVTKGGHIEENRGEHGKNQSLDKADKKLQAYCYRMCLTDLPENRVPFPKPAGYDPAQYELLLRIFAAGLGHFGQICVSGAHHRYLPIIVTRLNEPRGMVRI